MTVLRTRFWRLARASQCIRVAAQLRTVVAGVSLRVVARCGERRSAMALRPSEGGKLSTRSNST